MSENFREPQSANEAILQNILGAQNELREPQSVVEFYLQKILEQGGGSSVIANPTLEGTEAALSGLEVDGTKYKVESGGGSSAPLYEHVVQLKNAGAADSNIYCTVVSQRAEPYDLPSFCEYLQSIGITASNISEGGKSYPCTGRLQSNLGIPYGLFWYAGNSKLFVRFSKFMNSSPSYDSGSVTFFTSDTVTQIL